MAGDPSQRWYGSAEVRHVGKCMKRVLLMSVLRFYELQGLTLLTLFRSSHSFYALFLLFLRLFMSFTPFPVIIGRLLYY